MSILEEMVSAYTINTQKVEISRVSGIDISEPPFVGNFSIASKLDQLGIRMGAKAVVLKLEEDDFRFASAGEISKIFDTTIIKPSSDEIVRATSRGLPPPRDTYRHNFQLQVTQRLFNNNLLSELEYSLKDVYRYNNPMVHFQTQYRELNDDDYETIIDGLVYTARTAFGKLINSLPRQNKLEFMIQAINEFRTIDFTKISLQKGLDYLYDYIERRILRKGLLLVEIERLLEEKFSDILIPNEIGFIDPATEKHNNISIQAKYFEQLFNLDREHNFKDFVRKKIKENEELEIRFNKIFEKETWPIDLRL